MRASLVASGVGQQQVLPGAHGTDDVDDLRGTLGERVHVERIGDRQAVEPKPPAKKVANDLWGEARRQAGPRPLSAGADAWPVIASRAPAAMAARKGQARASRTVRGWRGHGESVMGVHGALAHAREVLDGRRDAGRLQAADERRRQLADGRRVITEQADSQRRVLRAGRQVTGRRVIDVDTHGVHLDTHRARHALGKGRVSGGTMRHGAGEGCRSVAQAVQLATFLVDGYQQRPPRLRRGGLDLRRQLPDLAWRFHVYGSKEAHSGVRANSDRGAHVPR